MCLASITGDEIIVFLEISIILDSRIFEFRLVWRPINFAIFSTITLFNSRKLRILIHSISIQFYVVCAREIDISMQQK